LGIDLVPSIDQFRPPDSRPAEPRPSVERRPGPSTEEADAFRPVASAVLDFVERELKSPTEKIGKPPEVLERFLSERDGPIAAIESVLLRGAEIQWEMDVTRGSQALLPNGQGLIRLQRLLVARALVEARRGEPEQAVQTLAASWSLVEVLSRRPESLAYVLVVSDAKLIAGAIRKVDSPAYGWAERLRSLSLLSGFYAAFQNQAWYSPAQGDDLTGKAGAYGRFLREMIEEVRRMDLCDWTPERLDEARTRSWRELQTEGNFVPAAPNQLESFQRWRRYVVEAELTALILDARAERAAARDHSWPEKLSTLGAGVCGGAGWSYRRSANGTATFAFEGRLAERESRALQLPMTFTAGTPVTPTPRPASKPTPRPTPRSAPTARR